MRYHFIPVRKVDIDKSINKCLQGCGEKGNPFALLVGICFAVATVASSMEKPQNIKNGAAL